MEVLQIIARENIVLATGHSSAAEDLLLVREAKKLGINHIIVTHPLAKAQHMTIPEMQEAAKMGAYIELCGAPLLPTENANGKIPVEVYVNVIRNVGADHVILSSDLGQAINPVHTDGWKLFLDILRKAGISDKELDAMDKTNPAELLGLQ
jgi:predicted TIM-barrel fold metal-dependent hydrolase